jgi:hypothetical protein
MSLRINGLTAREIVVAANRSKVKAPVNNLLRFAAEISGKALSQSSSFDWRAALARTQAHIESTMGEDKAQEILRPFFAPIVGTDLTDGALTPEQSAGLASAIERMGSPETQFRLPNEEAITTIVDEPAETDSDGGTCD